MGSRKILSQTYLQNMAYNEGNKMQRIIYYGGKIFYFHVCILFPSLLLPRVNSIIGISANMQD